MANQPKAYKKFVATAATATLVATAIAPVASAATDFKDVSKSYEEAVNYLVENGIAKGTTDTTFGTSNNISRGDAAVMIANALKLDTTSAPDAGFQDVNARVAGAVNAIVDAEIASGKTATSFDPAAYITRQEMAKMLANAYGLTAKENANFKDVNSNWIGYVSALKEAGITLGKTDTTFAPTENLTRGEFALFVYRAEVEVTPAPPVVTTATKVESVSATNLKEITVTFDGTVDATSGADKDNYSTNAGSIKHVTLSEDKKSATLTLADGTVMTNQTKYTLSVDSVKAGDKEVSVEDKEFTPLDNTLPEVAKVVALGNKAIKVQFNEPIKVATTNNFKLDGKTFFGNVNGVGSKELILKSFNNEGFEVGKHELTVSGIEDFSAFKSKEQVIEFEVAEDKEGPVVTEVKAVLEGVTVTFNEDVDPETVSKNNVYWKQGDSKRTADSFTQISGNKYFFDFSTNKLPAYETTLFFENIKDYSGNAITTKEVQVKAEVDQTRPEVLKVNYDANVAKNKFTLKFNKNVKAVTNSNVSVKDKDGDVLSVRNIQRVDGKTWEVELYNNLPTGTNTIKVSGVKDTTTLENTMLDYTTEIKIGDVTPPSFESYSANGRQVILTFDEKMDPSTLGDRSNYTFEFNGSTRTLPSSVQISVVQDGKAVLLVFPEKIGNDTVQAGTNLTKVTVMGVKDLAGNILDGYSETVTLSAVPVGLVTNYSSTHTGVNTIVDGKRTVKVKFDQPIGDAKKEDFVIGVSGQTGYVIESVKTDGSTVVELTVNKDLPTLVSDVTVGIQAKAAGTKETNIKSTVGNVFEVSSNGATDNLTIKDLLKPELVFADSSKRLVTGTNKITLEFSEALGGTASQYAHDLVVTRVSDDKVLVPGVDFDTAANGANKVDIQLKGNNSASYYTVKIKSGANYIQDATGNKPAETSAYTTSSEVGVDNVAPTVTASKFVVATDGVSPAVDTIEGQAGAVGEAGATVKAYVWTDTNTDGVVDTAELAPAITLGTSTATGTVAAASIGDLAAGTYKLVITATDASGNESAKNASAVVTIVLAN